MNFRYIKIKRFIMFLTSCLALTVLHAQENIIQVERVHSAVYNSHVSLGGTVVPFKEMTIYAQVSGEVDFIAGIEGDAFKLGELLISTDNRTLLTKRKAMVAQWKRSMASYQKAESQYNRELWSPKSEQPMPGMAMPNLMDQVFTRRFSDSMGVGDKGAENRSNLVAVKSQVSQAIADMERVKALISEIDVQLTRTKLLAPFDGIIVKKKLEVGVAVQPGSPLLVFAKSKHLSIEVDVPVNLMQNLKKGQIFSAKLSNKVPVAVRISQIFPVANNQQHTVKVKFDLPVGVPAAPGMYAEVEIQNSNSRHSQYPIVPSSAIKKRGSLPAVYVINPETSEVEMKIVRIGKEYKKGLYMVLSGLKVGEFLLINPPVSVDSGMVFKQGKLLAADSVDK